MPEPNPPSSRTGSGISFPSCPAPTGHLLARRSITWTLSTLSPRNLCAKVHALDPQYTFPQDSLREGPHSGPSVHFSPGFFARRSTLWTLSTLFPRIPCAKVHTLDPQYTFPQDSLREGPHSGPSVHFSPGFLARRSTLWTLGIAEGIPFLLHLKHTHLVLNRLQSLTPCFNHSLNTPLKHTYPVQPHLRGPVLCFNYPFNTPLKHNHPVLSHL